LKGLEDSSIEIAVDHSGADAIVRLKGHIDAESSPEVRDRYITTVLALFSLIILAGCSGKMRYPSYYTLNLPAPPDPPAPGNVKATAAIREFSAPAYLRRGAIVFKTSLESIGFYSYHRWAVDPCEFVTDSMRDRLSATGLFAQVKRYDGRPDAEYLVSGRLEKLEEIDYAVASRLWWRSPPR
jgi:ABC-type uncharacterized transport system auxiliary subunit